MERICPLIRRDLPLVQDRFDLREVSQGRIWKLLPQRVSGVIGIGIKRIGWGSGSTGNDNPADHPGHLVRCAVIIVNSFDRQPNFKLVARIHQITGIPRYGRSRNAQGMLRIGRMKGGGCVNIGALIDPTDPLARADQQADGIEEHV